MISLRKHIEDCQTTLTESTLAAFRAALIAMGECGNKAVPGVGSDLHHNLTGIQGTLSQPVTSDSLTATTEQVGLELSQWADRAFQHHLENEREIREIMAAVTRTAESVGFRDERFTKEVGELTARLRQIAETPDIGAIRRAILENTVALQTCVEAMTAASRSAIQDLTSQVAEYRVQLQKSERDSAADQLTRLANRRAFERRLRLQIDRGEPFCLILIDMDNFKEVNDTFGHIAGDHLLREFATELQAQFRPEDLVARWGGDEFAVLISGSLRAGEAGVERIRRWVLGEYKIDTGQETVKIVAGASVAAVQWKPGESGLELLARADKGVYKAKSARR
ncbi:MAG: GGDEF domain-containing protein [Acidobacteriota bacterium]|nr:GGDEF domain-containing protein [Acidobacteriota bacterium]